MFFTFFKLYKWYQITQCTIYVLVQLPLLFYQHLVFFKQSFCSAKILMTYISVPSLFSKTWCSRSANSLQKLLALRVLIEVLLLLLGQALRICSIVLACTAAKHIRVNSFTSTNLINWLCPVQSSDRPVLIAKWFLKLPILLLLINMYKFFLQICRIPLFFSENYEILFLSENCL